MNPPLVSVLMPVYNTERYVARAIESMLQQTLTQFELLILDDGSTDGSLQILQAYTAQDKRIRLTSRENQGIPRSRNQLLQQAQAEWIAPMDSDDIARPDRLARQVAFLQQHPEVACVGSAYQLIDAQGRLLLTRFGVPETNAEIQQSLLAGLGGIHQPCAMFRRSLALAVGGYDETMPVCEDLDLWLRLGEVGELANLPEPLLQYRLHRRSITEQRQALELEQSRRACEQAWQRRQISGRFEASGEWRPTRERASQHRFALQYGWWAFNSQQRQTALVYGSRAVALNPLSIESWRLLTCAAVKPLPRLDPL